MDPFLPLETHRLLLRPLSPDDTEALFRYRSQPEVYRYQLWRPRQLRDVRTFLQRNARVIPNTPDTWLQVGICLRDGPLIGDIGMHFLWDNTQVEIGFTLSPAYQGHGYAFEAVTAILGYLFTTLKKHRISALAASDNRRSLRLLERIGMRKEAHFIKNIRINDQWCDECVYAMLEEEWTRLTGVGEPADEG